MGRHTRREFLIVSAIPPAIGGCLGLGSGEESPPPSDGGDESTPPTDGDDRSDAFYVENLDRTSYEAKVSVTAVAADTDDQIVDGRYEVPARTGLRFPDVGELGERYEVRVHFDGEAYDHTWEVVSCEGTDGPDGNRAAGARIENESVEIHQNVCDLLHVGEMDVDYVPASEHRIYE